MTDVVAAILFKHGLERIAGLHTVTGTRWFGLRMNINCAACGHRWPCLTRLLATAVLADGQDELMDRSR